MSTENLKEIYVYVVRVKTPSPEPTRSQRSFGPSPVQTIQLASQPPKTWLFQSNPQLYDLRAALRTLKEQVWSVSRYAKEIRTGDRIYLWEAGPYGGVIGVAEVSEPPCCRPEPWEQLAFIRAHDVFLKERVRTKLRILQVFDPLVQRHVIIDRPEFRTLAVLRCSRGTNFRLSEEETDALDSLIQQMAA